MISICTTYYNRWKQFEATLKRFEELYESNDYELIVVDDASDEENKLVNKNLKEFNVPIKLIEIGKEYKRHVNPCVPFNIAFSQAKGDIIIIQNPENIHVGNILDCAKNIKTNQYWTFACYSTTPEMAKLIQKNGVSAMDNYNYNERSASIVSLDSWYNHSKYRPFYYHFCSAIRKDDLEDLGGFDLEYADGTGYDDSEFLYRIELKKMDKRIIDTPFVIHQYHTGFCGKDSLAPKKNNHALYHNYTRKMTSHKIKQNGFGLNIK